jgi:carboxypeptidase Q
MRNHAPYLTLLLCAGCLSTACSGTPPDSVARALIRAGFPKNTAFTLLKELTEQAGHRLSGSAGSLKALDVTQQMMRQAGLTHVRVESVMVPHWERGTVEEAVLLDAGGRRISPLSVCALGGSVGTPIRGITADVVEVQSFDQLRALGKSAVGKIVFFNRPMDPTRLDPFNAYGGAVDQRGRGAVEAARAGGVAAIVRSVTTARDNVPHTGAMGYVDSVRRVPAVAIGIEDADRLSALITRGPTPRVRIRLDCRVLPDAPSGNALGELTGSEFPDQIIVVGGHIDAWDKGTGAHDDGAGCVQAIEALRLLREIGVRPRRTLRAVMFMNEENGLRGGRGYAASPNRDSETPIAALESDRGGFAPRGFSVQADSATFTRVRQWQSLLELLDAGKVETGHGGVDITPIVDKGTPGFGLLVDRQRYFDYHHSANDTLDKVHPRELEHGAIVMAFLLYLISEQGL